MILQDGREMKLTICKPSKTRAVERGEKTNLVVLEIPFVVKFSDAEPPVDKAEREIGKLMRLANETRVIFGHGNNANTVLPRVMKSGWKYTWRFIGAPSHIARFIAKILTG